MSCNVLIVDDSLSMSSVIRKTLTLSKFHVDDFFEAPNGREALNVLASSWVDAVITDINMPVMNGIELIERMEADGLLKSIPVVVISTEGSATRMDALKAKGIKGYIRKPFSPETIKKILLEILGEGPK